MPLLANNGSGVTIPKWLLPIVLALFLTGAGAWTSVSFQAWSALPRLEAAQTYVSMQQYREDRKDDRAWQLRMETKVDKLLER